MPLSDVLYQNAAQSHLQRALRAGRMPHAYLFTGPAGVGKEMLATRLAQVLLCTNVNVSGGVTPQSATSHSVTASVAAIPPEEHRAEAAMPSLFGETSDDATPSLFGDDSDDATPSLFGEPPRNEAADVPVAGSASSPRESGSPVTTADPLHGDTQPLDACGHCTDCVLFAAGNHPDYHRIHRMLAKLHPEREVRNRKATMLGVDVIRHFLLNPIGVRPGRGRAKIFVVVEAERLSDEAQNAMLKTLEEPPPQSYLILLATSPDAMLATTRSRCQQVSFGTLPREFIVERLRSDRGLPPAASSFLAELSQGSVGVALRYAELGLHEQVTQVASTVIRALSDPLGASKALQDFAKELATPLKQNQDDDEADTNATRDAQVLVLAMISTILRDAQRRIVGATPLALGDHEVVSRLVDAADTRSLRAAIRAMSAAEYQVGRNVNAGLIFDTAAIALGRASLIPA